MEMSAHEVVSFPLSEVLCLGRMPLIRAAVEEKDRNWADLQSPFQALGLLCDLSTLKDNVQ